MKWTLRLINNAAFLLVIRGAVLQQLRERDSRRVRPIMYTHPQTWHHHRNTWVFINFHWKKKTQKTTLCLFKRYLAPSFLKVLGG